VAVVSDPVDARVLPQVEIPVGAEAAAGVKGAELEDSCGAFRPHLAPVTPILSLTSHLPAPSATPVARAVFIAQGEQAADHNWPVWSSYSASINIVL
jgi:hypothetical protein